LAFEPIACCGKPIDITVPSQSWQSIELKHSGSKCGSKQKVNVKAGQKQKAEAHHNKLGLWLPEMTTQKTTVQW